MEQPPLKFCVGIDPGICATGIVAFTLSEEPRLFFAYTLRPPKRQPRERKTDYNIRRLQYLTQRLQSLLRQAQPLQQIAIEAPHGQRNAAASYALGATFGLALASALQALTPDGRLDCLTVFQARRLCEGPAKARYEQLLTALQQKPKHYSAHEHDAMVVLAAAMHSATSQNA